MKTNMIVLMVLVVIAIMALVSSCQQDTPLEDPILECERVGGEWMTFNDACADLCEYERGFKTFCAQVVTESCECGQSSCWNGRTCEPI